LKEFF